MDGILLHVDAEFLPQGARRCLVRVGSAHHVSQGLDSLISLQQQWNDRPRRHVGSQAVEERPLAVHGVKPLGVVLAEADHFQPQHDKPFALQAREELAGQIAPYGVRFNDG